MNLFALNSEKKARVLEKAAEIIKQETSGDCVRGTNPKLRNAIVRGMNELGYANMGVGGKREISITQQIGKANFMGTWPDTVAKWGEVNSKDTVIAGIRATVEMLNRRFLGFRR